MADEQRILQLLESMLESGSTPEEACTGCPELLPTVRERWKQLQGVGAQLEAFFPDLGAAAKRPPQLRNDLPQIPGYEVQAVLGHGGMGVVYKTLHQKLNRVVALKMLLSGAYASRIELTRFMREARAIASLRHPHLVQVYDIGELDGCPYFTMEFMEGGSLTQKLGGVPQPPQEAAALLVLLASAVQTAHDGGIVHRDLKPSNILLTTDGTPKISDFGVARRLEDEADLTLSGLRIGTPSYMAPEQAAGRTIAIGPPADIYALGAVLYEMLTGRPPFRGVSAADTERQVINDDPAAPRRLNTSVPRDLETICLKCLQKDPRRRYPSAAELVNDLTRFQRGEPILARKTGKAELTTKWVRRHPAISTGVVGSLLLLCLFLSAGVWWLSQRSALTRAVDDDLQDAVRFQQNGNYTNADAYLERATLRLGDHGPAELQHRLELVRRDSQLVAKLGQINRKKWRTETTADSFAETVRAYEETFKDAGFGSDADAPAVVADRICHCSVRLAVLDALDDWTRCLDDDHGYWIIKVAELVDPAHSDPGSWRAQVRNTDPKLRKDGKRLGKLVDEADVEHEPATVLMQLMRRYADLGGTPTDFLKRIQEAHPLDFQANLELGFYMDQKGEYLDAIRCFQTAIAVQPDAALVHYNLGTVLVKTGHPDEARVEFERAVKLNPADSVFQGYLGMAYCAQQQFERATPHLEAGLQADPAHASFLLNLHSDLAECYANIGRDTEVTEQYRLTIGLQPDINKDQEARRKRLIREGRAAELCAAWQWALKTDPSAYDARDGYAELCLLVGDVEAYQKECATLLKQFGKTSNAGWCTSIGMACLLAEQSPQDLARTVAMVNRAVAADPNFGDPLTRLVQALSEYRQDHSKAAIALLQANFPLAVRPTAGLILAMAQFHDGQPDLAHKTLSDVTNNNDWDLTKSLTPRQWISQVLRREAEKTIAPN